MAPLSAGSMSELGVDGDNTQTFTAHTAERRAASRVVRQNEPLGQQQRPEAGAPAPDPGGPIPLDGDTPASSEPLAEPDGHASDVISIRTGGVPDTTDVISVHSHGSQRSARSSVYQARINALQRENEALLAERNRSESQVASARDTEAGLPTVLEARVLQTGPAGPGGRSVPRTGPEDSSMQQPAASVVHLSQITPVQLQQLAHSGILPAVHSPPRAGSPPAGVTTPAPHGPGVPTPGSDRMDDGRGDPASGHFGPQSVNVLNQEIFVQSNVRNVDESRSSIDIIHANILHENLVRNLHV